MPFDLHLCKVALGIRVTEKGISCIDFLPYQETLEIDGAIAKQVVTQFQDYLIHPQQGFHLPLDLVGTPFQLRVWEQLCLIPPGEPISYGELARRLGSGARAVGNACRRNPVPIVVPCHRVVSTQGLGGYSGAVAGEKLRIKQALLAHEARNID